MPLTGGYDVKVIDGSGLYGLPMYRVGTGALTPPPAPLPLGTDAATGLQAASFNLAPSFTLVTASTGRYYTNGGNASFQNRRPIEPFTKLDVTQSGFIAHGALLTGAVSNDQANFNAAFSRPVEDRAAFSPELVGDATSPTRLQSIATFSTPTGLQQRLVISTGQFLADGVPDALGIGSQRLYSSLTGVVLYSPEAETDFRAPTFGPVQAFASTPSTIGFAVDVDDSEGRLGEARAGAVQGRHWGMAVGRPFPCRRLGALERRRSVHRLRSRVVHPGCRRARERWRDQQQGPYRSGHPAHPHRWNHRGRDRPVDQRVVHGQRDRDDQWGARHHVQPRRLGLRCEFGRHRLRHRPAHGRVPGLQRRPRDDCRPDRHHCSDHRLDSGRSRARPDLRFRLLRVRRRRLGYRLVHDVRYRHVDADPQRGHPDRQHHRDRSGRPDDEVCPTPAGTHLADVPRRVRVPRLLPARRQPARC